MTQAICISRCLLRIGEDVPHFRGGDQHLVLKEDLDEFSNYKLVVLAYLDQFKTSFVGCMSWYWHVLAAISFYRLKGIIEMSTQNNPEILLQLFTPLFEGVEFVFI